MVPRLPKISQQQRLVVPLTSNHDVASPLRYPGGKSVLSGFIAGLIARSGMDRPLYVEPYAGGAGVALRLLMDDLVSGIVINDYDPDVFAFWDSAVNHSREFLDRFDRVEPTMDEWRRQKRIIRDPADELDRGFAFFFLNRTNRSGVINGGVIGGLAQSGRYKVSARYNEARLREKLAFLGEHSPRIEVTCRDGRQIARQYASRTDAFTYLDPPYVVKGGSLYLNALTEQQHRDLAATLAESDGAWMLTYDDTELTRTLYAGNYGGVFPLRYAAASRREATELMAFSDMTAASLRPDIWRGDDTHGEN